MSLAGMPTIVERYGRIDVVWSDLTLMTYVYQPETRSSECPKPYLHPVRTLDGDVVTALRPNDHRWHAGVFLGFPKISGEDFWGGPTWVPDEGWVQLDNVGSVRHDDWNSVDDSNGAVRLSESLTWRASSGEPLLSERRLIEVTDVNPSLGAWRLGVESTLRNVSGRDLMFTTPASAGLTGYGYGGWTWRGVRAFAEAEVFTELDSGQTSAHGSRARWLAVAGEHDEHDRSSTVVFVDRPSNPRHPTCWAVWLEFVMVCFADLFEHDRSLAPERALALGYDIVVANGRWSRSQVASYVESQVDGGIPTEAPTGSPTRSADAPVEQ